MKSWNISSEEGQMKPIIVCKTVHWDTSEVL